MCTSFSDDDVGKRVETADGETVGVVRTTGGGTLYVDADEGSIDAIRAVVDTDPETDEIVPVGADAVADVTTESIRLVDERSTQEGIDRDEGTEDEYVDGERRELGPGAGEPDAEELPEGEGRSGKSVEPETDEMQEAGAERHPAEEAGDEPDDGERTVTKDRGREDDR